MATPLEEAKTLADELKAKATKVTADSGDSIATQWLAAEVRAERLRAEAAE